MELTDELFAKICERIADGESLRAICQDPAMPAQGTVYRHLTDKPEWQERYARARETQADALADEILDVARLASNKTFQQDRLLVDALKWRAGKLKPKVYGDKQDINLTGQLDVAQTILAARKRSGG